MPGVLHRLVAPHLYGAAIALGVLVAAGRAATRRLDARWFPRPARRHGRTVCRAGRRLGPCGPVYCHHCAATLRRRCGPGRLANIGHWTPIVGQVTPVIGVRLGYVAGASAFAAGYLVVLLLSPLAGCGLGAWAGRAADRPDPAPLRPRR